jgi:hypothetical protein
VNQRSTYRRLPTTYLDHDHRERENVRFLAICPLLDKDLWSSPSRGVTSKAKIRDACTAGVIHKNVWLVGYQYDGEMRFKISAYTLEISMNDIAGVEVAKAFSDIR